MTPTHVLFVGATGSILDEDNLPVFSQLKCVKEGLAHIASLVTVRTA